MKPEIRSMAGSIALLVAVLSAAAFALSWGMIGIGPDDVLTCSTPTSHRAPWTAQPRWK